MQLKDIIDIICTLAKVRKLFWSEDDFKFAFATEIQLKFGKLAEVRLEKRYKDDRGKNSYTDIVVRMNGKNYPIELKYKTVKGSYMDTISKSNTKGEVVELMTHSAVDLGCYAYLKDIERLEYLANTDDDFERGFAIILTSESLYYRNTDKPSVYDSFKIYEDRKVSGHLDWDLSRYPKGKIPSWVKTHPALVLNNQYVMKWADYGGLLVSNEDPSSSVQFRYLISVIEKERSC